MEICKTLKEIRTTLGLTQIIFAQKLHVSFSTVNRWENGRVKPNSLAIVTLIEFAKQNGIDSSLISELQKNILNKGSDL